MTSDGPGALHMARHGQIMAPTGILMNLPGRVGLPQMKTGLTDGNPVQIIISPFQSLGEDVPAKRAEHGKKVRFCDILYFVGTKNPYWQDIKGVIDLLRRVSAEITDHFAAGPFFPVFLIFVTVFKPLLKLFYGHYEVPPLKATILYFA
jgi:hypothetical protein